MRESLCIMFVRPWRICARWRLILRGILRGNETLEILEFIGTVTIVILVLGSVIFGAYELVLYRIDKRKKP
jgi:hypothetical protein